MMHILSADQFSEEMLNRLFDLADEIRSYPHRWQDALSGKLMGTLFFEPSTRTRWSSEAAMLRLGGQCMSMQIPQASSATKGETLSDTLRNCSQLVDVLVARHPDVNSVQEAAKCSDVPVINGGDGSNEHPTQALLDYYTIRRHFPDLTGKKLLFTGDQAHSRTINSLAVLLRKHTPIEMWQAFPRLMTQREVMEQWGFPPSRGRPIHEPKLPGERCMWEQEVSNRIAEFDIVYMTRPQKERWGPSEVPSTFVMTAGLAKRMREDAVIMHPGPRNSELSACTDADHRAKYFEMTKNGMWVRMALLWDLLGCVDK